jgi:protein-S-isoprenylcysteine O-methyltransferase Ste14
MKTVPGLTETLSVSIVVTSPLGAGGFLQRTFDSVVPGAAISLLVWAKWTTLVRLSSNLVSGQGELAPAVLQLTQEAVTVAFFALVALLYVVRRSPLKRVRDLPTALVSFIGAWITTAIAMSPKTIDVAATNAASSLAIAAGTGFALWGLLHLRRCFSILPEARGLVRSGPYRFVRHPLYLGEFIAATGMLLTAFSPVTVAVFAVFAALQLRRMAAEEKVLGSIFPEYEEYARLVPRLVPRIVH